MHPLRLSLFALLFLAVFSVEDAEAETLVVDIHGNGTFVSIQDALDASVIGDTIRVWNGTYNENVEINHTLNLIGNGSASLIIYEGNAAETGVDVVRINAEWVNLSGFKIKGGYNGINLGDSSYVTISDSLVTDNNIGIRCSKCNYTIIKNSTITENKQIGIGLSRSSQNNINNNTVSGNDYGIKLEYGNHSKISDNIIIENDYGIYTSYSSSNKVIGNTILENERGILISLSKFNTVYKNTVTEHVEYGVFMFEEEYCTVSDNFISNGDKISIVLGSSLNCNVSNNTLMFNHMNGINLHLSDDNIIYNNTITEHKYALVIDESDRNSFRENNISHNLKNGIMIQKSNNNLISDNYVSDNDQWGMTSDKEIIAQHNWWGHETGPYHPELNPNGLGDEVSDNIDFSNWIGYVDSDNDGVQDYYDDCPNSEEEVNDSGCSLSQRDSDGDGVTDDKDECPNVTGAGINEVGCRDKEDILEENVSDTKETPSPTEGADEGLPGFSAIMAISSIGLIARFRRR